MKLNKDEILEYQQNREPYLLIDYVEKVEPGVSAKGYVDINKSKNWILDVHWPNDKNFPGMLQIESLIQMGALILLTLPGNKGKVVYVISANNLSFKRKVLPGDRLLLYTKLISFKRGIADIESVGKIDDQTVCKANFKIVLPDVAIKYKIG
jgi:3-hydroxyacyl-[acyl-carrier-protein] dehydratase